MSQSVYVLGVYLRRAGDWASPSFSSRVNINATIYVKQSIFDVSRCVPAPSWGLGSLPNGLHALLDAKAIDGGLEGGSLGPLLLPRTLLFLQSCSRLT